MITADHSLAAKLEWLAEYLQLPLDILSREEAPLVHEMLQTVYLEAYRSAAYLYAEGMGVDPTYSNGTEETLGAETLRRSATSGRGY